MLRFVVVGVCLDSNELLLNYKGRVFRFVPKCPAFYYRVGEIIRVKGAV